MYVDTCRRQKGASDSLGPELQVVVSHLILMLGAKLRSRAKAAGAFNHGAISSLHSSSVSYATSLKSFQIRFTGPVSRVLADQA